MVNIIGRNKYSIPCAKSSKLAIRNGGWLLLGAGYCHFNNIDNRKEAILTIPSHPVRGFCW